MSVKVELMKGIPLSRNKTTKEIDPSEASLHCNQKMILLRIAGCRNGCWVITELIPSKTMSLRRGSERRVSRYLRREERSFTLLGFLLE